MWGILERVELRFRLRDQQILHHGNLHVGLYCPEKRRDGVPPALKYYAVFSGEFCALAPSLNGRGWMSEIVAPQNRFKVGENSTLLQCATGL